MTSALPQYSGTDTAVIQHNTADVVYCRGSGCERRCGRRLRHLRGSEGTSNYRSRSYLDAIAWCVRSPLLCSVRVRCAFAGCAIEPAEEPRLSCVLCYGQLTQRPACASVATALRRMLCCLRCRSLFLRYNSSQVKSSQGVRKTHSTPV